MAAVNANLKDKPALQNTLTSFQKLKEASSSRDPAAIKSGVQDMKARIAEGVRDGSLNRDDATALQNIASSFQKRNGGDLSARGELGAQVPHSLDQFSKHYHQLADGDVNKHIDAYRQTPEAKALSPEVRSEVEQAMTSAFRTARERPFSVEGAKRNLAEMNTHVQALEGFAAKGLMKREDLQSFKDFAGRYGADIQRTEERAPLVRAQREAGRQALYGQGQQTLDTLQRIEDFRDSKNGWYSSGSYRGNAADAALKSLQPLRDALARPDTDPNKATAVKSALDQAKERLAAFPRGRDPAEVLSIERENNLKNLARAGDVAGLIPGPIGKALSLSLKSAETGIRYASGEMSGAELATRTLFNIADTAGVGDKIGGSGSLFSQALRGAGYGATKDMITDGVRIANDPKLTPDQKTEALENAAKASLVNAYQGAIRSTLGKLTGGIESADKKALVDNAIKAAEKLGIDPVVGAEIDKLKALPTK